MEVIAANGKIIGKTTINHNKRTRLKLTVMEYCVMEYLYECEIKKYDPVERCYKHFGYTYKQVEPLIHKLQKAGFLEGFIVTKKYGVAKKADLEAEFEILFEMLRRRGSKAKGLASYKILRKTEEFEYLKSRVEAYMATDPQLSYQMHASTFFNEKDRNFEQEFVAKEKKRVMNFDALEVPVAKFKITNEKEKL